MKKASIIYQFLVLVSIIIFNGYFIMVKGELNEILIGALIGVLVGLPFSTSEEPKKDKTEE